MSADTNSMIADLQGMKVDQLKLTIRRLNETCAMHLRISGVKSDLYGRCRSAVYELAAQPDKTRYNLAKRIITEARDSHGGYSPSSSGSYGYQYQAAQQLPVRPAAPAYGASNYSGYGAGAALPAKPALPAPRFGAAANAYASGSGASGDYGYGASTNGSAAAAAPARNEEVPMLFRPNPFYKVERSLCGVTVLPKAGQGDRKSVVCNFALTEPQRTALAKSKASPANPQYQVRLYCTNEDYFNPHRPSSSQVPAPIDFPATCEIKLNYFNVPANTKGIKKQVGTASPVDLAKGNKLDISAGAINRLEVIYVNTEKQSTRRYFMVVYLVEVTTIKQLVDRVKTGKQKTKEEVIQSIIRMNSDPDMEASALTVSLKDPLTLARIKTPIRSNVCTHVSCFDAEVWFMINEQTPTWNCPICSKVLRVDDLVHDNFFLDVLKTIGSAEVDAITVEPDGTWRSDNDKFGTAQPKSVVPSRAGSVKPDISGLNSLEGSTAPEGKGKGKAVVTEALTLDSDDDDDDDLPLAKRPRLNGAGGGYRTSLGGTLSIDSSPAPAFGGSNGGGGPPPPRRMETIDLTLSDSDDDAPPPPRPARPLPAAHSAYVPPPPVPRPNSAASSSNGGAGSSGYGATDFQAQETLRKQLAEQAQRRQIEDIRRRREEEAARSNGNGAGRGAWEGDGW
ncbi:PINIT domain-domain-containing protein [Leucosporidium creatinivorum]|uniref:PINIT domain-domain-containing protein n=1 Tax=Leucosporidium creatinivorum TaxID=106004 RepID=A0A1Y2DL61_9BASI|nr:PINIT domain-domain-containing protein [Leucosporidium creatinivorum]